MSHEASSSSSPVLRTTTEFWTLVKLSHCVGALVGIFLQCSMLGIYSYFITSKSTTITTTINTTTNNNGGGDESHEWSVEYNHDGSALQRLDTLYPGLMALAWSLLVSLIGIIILQTIRAMVVAVVQIPFARERYESLSTTESPNDGASMVVVAATDNTPLVESIMAPTSMGALVGVSVASVLITCLGAFQMCHFAVTDNHVESSSSPTNVSLLLREVSILVLAVLGVWMLWTVLLVRGVGRSRHARVEETSDLSEPLLGRPSSKVATTVSPTVSTTTLKRTLLSLQCASLFFGSLVGWLIQCSSLSANFFVVQYHQIKVWQQQQQQQQQQLSIDTDAEADGNAMRSVMLHLEAATARRQIILTSLAWSFVASTVGIVLLFLVRALLMKVANLGGSATATASPLSVEDVSELSSKVVLDTNVSTCRPNVLLHVECWFAVGTVVGLNLAWTITEYVMSVNETHWLQSLWIFMATMIWCQIVLYGCGYRSRRQPSLPTTPAKETTISTV